jgi:hypothetical protein
VTSAILSTMENERSHGNRSKESWRVRTSGRSRVRSSAFRRPGVGERERVAG